MTNISHDIKKFFEEHKTLSILTAGIAIIGYAIGKLCGKLVTHIKKCLGTSKKTDEVALNIVNQQKSNSSPAISKPVTTEISPSLNTQIEVIKQINTSQKPEIQLPESPVVNPEVSQVGAQPKKEEDSLSEEKTERQQPPAETVSPIPVNSEPSELKEDDITIQKIEPETEEEANLKVTEMWKEIQKLTQKIFKETSFQFTETILNHRDVPNMVRRSPDQVMSRFPDIMCPKETVVKVDGTYLHANHIQTKETPIQFIAAQAPLQTDHYLFWKAVFDGDYSIIDLTNPKDKIVAYSPVEITKKITVENFVIDCEAISSNRIKNGQISYKYNIRDTKTGEEKSIVRLHFNEWPDHGVITIQQLENILALFESEDLDEKLSEKVIVHCRAGVGRTGTIITAQIMKEKIARKEVTRENLDQQLISLIVELRKSRGDFFVQREEQFALVRAYALSLLG